MKTVLFFQTCQEEDVQVIQNIEAMEIHVRCTKSLSRMHDLIISGNYYAIVVNQNFLTQHKIHPAHHLWEARSPVTIISFHRNETKTEANAYNIPSKISGIVPKKDQGKVINDLLETIRNTKTQQDITASRGDKKRHNGNEESSGTMYPELKILPTEMEMQMHKKMHKIFDILVQSGNQGVSTTSFTNQIWGEGLDKKSDIQIYISKLRTLLSHYFDGRYIISLEEDCYYLEKSPVAKIKFETDL